MTFSRSTHCFGLIAAAVTVGALYAAPAMAQHSDRGRGGYQHGYGSDWHGGRSYDAYRHHNDSGVFVGGALLGLGVGTVLGGAYLAPPPVVYAPPTSYYYYRYGPPPYYAYPYAAPPPVYYGN